MLSISPISLAQLKAGNNLDQLKNEILTKAIYKSSIDNI